MKLTGPFMSLEASGSFANTITAALWNHRQYIKKKGRPRQPRTLAQRQARARIGHLKTFWKYMADIDDFLCQDEWTAANPDPTISAFNFYIRTNLDRWASGRSPIFSPTFNIGNSTQDQYVGVVPGRNQISWTANNVSPSSADFGTLWFLSTNSGGPSASELIWISPAQFFLPAPPVITLKFITPGTYYIYSQCFYGNGVLDSNQYGDGNPYTVTG